MEREAFLAWCTLTLINSLAFRSFCMDGNRPIVIGLSEFILNAGALTNLLHYITKARMGPTSRRNLHSSEESPKSSTALRQSLI